MAVTTRSKAAKDSAAASSASAAADRGDLDPSPLPALLPPPDTAADETSVAAAGDASHSRADRCLSPAVSGGMGGPALTEFETECVQQYAADPYFASDTNTNAFRLERGLYFRGQALVIPDGNGLREKCLQAVHTSPYAGHCRFAKTRKLLARSFWWPNLNASVKKFIAHCASCQRSKSPNDLPGGLLQTLPVPPGLWDSVSMDLITSLPLTDHGFTAIIVFVDRLSKMAHFVPTVNEVSAVDCAQWFRHQVLRLHGCPRNVVSDRDPRFTSNFFAEFCRLAGVEQHMSSAFHPQSDGQKLLPLGNAKLFELCVCALLVALAVNSLPLCMMLLPRCLSCDCVTWLVILLRCFASAIALVVCNYPCCCCGAFAYQLLIACLLV